VELIDIFDANMRPAGSMAREQAHQLGVWHRTLHLWLVERAGPGRLLFQLRGPDVASNPGKFDATAAGHLVAGEDERDGLREIREELGIEVPAALRHLGYRTEARDLPNGHLNREFQSIYLAELPEATVFSPDPAEVHGVFAIAISALFGLFDGTQREARAAGIAYDAALGVWSDAERDVCLDDFVPRFERYYLNVAIMAERLLEGREPLAIG
jgi:isopentenyldiphosphate isomerase